MLKVFESAEEIAVYCADLIESLILKKPDCVLGLATGASPIPTYRELIRRYEAGRISFRQVKTFNLDEYCGIPRDDKNSYYTFMHEQLFDHIDIREENVHIPDGNATDPAAFCKQYDQMIRDAGGIDLQILGVGTNGHIGFNEPADKFTKGTFCIALAPSTKVSNSIYFENGKVPDHAVTMGIATIMSARQIVLIATGEKKRFAVSGAVNGDITPMCPASVLQLHPNAQILADRAAATLV